MIKFIILFLHTIGLFSCQNPYIILPLFDNVTILAPMTKQKKVKPKSKQIKRPKEKLVSVFFELYFLPLMLILLLPFANSNETMDMNAAPRIIILSVVIVLFSLYSLTRIKKPNQTISFIKLPIFIVAVLYIVWMLITLAFAINPGDGSFDVAKSLLTLGLLVYLTKVLIDHQTKALGLFVKTIIISAIIASTIGIYQYITKVHGKADYDLYMALYNIKGLMAHKNQFSISLMLMLPFTIYGLFTYKTLWRITAGYTTIMILINIFLIQTRSVWVATLMFLLIFGLLESVFLIKNNFKGFLIKHKKPIGISLGTILVVVLLTFVLIKDSDTSSLLKEQASTTFNTKSANAQHRIKMWNASLQLFEDHPWLGVGAGNWKVAVIPYYRLDFDSKYQNWMRPHNDFLWVLDEKGVFGLVLFLAIFGFIFYFGFRILFSEKNKNHLLITLLMMSGIAGYMFASLFSFPLERINHQVYLTLMMAVIIANYAKHTNKVNNILFRRVNLTILFLALLSAFYSFYYLNSELYVKKAYEATQDGNQRKVIKYCDKAYSIFTNTDANNVPIKMFRALAQMKLNNLQQAYADLQSAYNDFPTQVAVLNNLGIVAAQLHKNTVAVAYFKRSLYLFPHYEKTLANLVIAYYQQKKYEEAYLTLLNQDTRKPNKQYNNFEKGLKKLINTQK